MRQAGVETSEVLFAKVGDIPDVLAVVLGVYESANECTIGNRFAQEGDLREAQNGVVEDINSSLPVPSG